MPTAAVVATIAQAAKMARNPATASTPVSLQSIATAAGYPGNKASSVRGLARANGNGARANGQGRYTHNTPGAWHQLLTGASKALQPDATAQARKAQGTAKVRTGWLGKQAAATAKGKRAAKQAAKQATPAEPTAQAQPQADTTAQATADTTAQAQG